MTYLVLKEPPRRTLVNPLTDDKILGLSKLKSFAGDKSNVTQNIKVVFLRIENIVGKEENTGYWLPAFLAHLSTECSVSYCDHSPSVVVRPSDVRQQFSC